MEALAHKTYGDDALCSGQIYPMIPKQQYKLSTLFPLAEANSERLDSTDASGVTHSKILDTRYAHNTITTMINMTAVISSQVIRSVSILASPVLRIIP